MPRSTQATFSFGAGVLSPSMEMRADLDRYSRALRSMRNWVVTPQGGMIKRHGFEYIDDQKDPTSGVGRLFTFHRGGNESDILVEMTEQALRFRLDDSLLQASGGGDLEITHQALWTMLPDVQAVNQEKTMVLVHPDMPPLLLTVEADNTITAQEFPFGNVPRRIFSDKFAPSSISLDVTYSVRFSTSFLPDDQFWFSYNGKINQTADPVEPLIIRYVYRGNEAAQITELERACDEHPDIGAGTNTSRTVTGGATDQFFIQLVGPNAGRVMDLIPIGGSENNAVTIDVTAGDPTALEEPSWSYPYVVTHTPGTTYYQCLQPHQSDATNEPGTGASWTDFWVALPGQPSWWDWQHGGSNAWATGQTYAPWGRGFPRTVTFHRERLYFGGSDSSFAGGLTVTPTGAPGAPTTIWGSRIGEFIDFQIGANDSDPVQFTLSTRGLPSISWMTSLQGLLVGTTAGHYRITGEPTITPSSVSVEKQNGARSAIDTPVTINNRVFSAQLGNTTVHSAAYQREALAILADDISIAAPHLFKLGVRYLALMQVPEDVVYMVRDADVDGNASIIGLTYNPETDVIGWWEWTSINQFNDIAVIFNSRTNEEELYSIVKAPVGGQQVQKVVYPLRDFSASNLDGFCWLDGFYRDTIVASNTITGIPARFEGETVRVTVNDADYGEFTVSGNTITLPQAVTGYVYIGYSVVSDALTFERSEGNPQGVSFGTARRWNKLYSRLISSALPKINGERSPDRTPASQMDLPEDLRSEDMRVHNLGFNDGSVLIEQDLPFPTHVVGLYGQVGTHDA